MLENVIGYDYIKEELSNIINWYNNDKILNDKNIKLPKGIVFYGNPGNGKTLFVRELRNAFDANAYVIKGDAEKIESEITKTYEEARKHPFSLVLVDELDLLIGDNSSLTRLFQDELDGINQDGGRVLTIATTNHFYSLPEALTRNGRFDRPIEITAPDKKTRIKIFEHFFNVLDIDGSKLSFDFLAEMTHFKSCADIIAICNDLALRHNGKTISNSDFLRSIDICNGRIRCISSNSIAHNRAIAIHEIGHALLTLKYSENYKLLMTSYCGNGGYTSACPVDESITNIEAEIQNIEITLAGNICEKLFNDFESTGSVDDLEKARNSANYIVNRYGIYGSSTILKRFDSEARMETEKTRYRNEKLSNKLIRKCERCVVKYLITKKELVYTLTTMMQEKGYLLEDDFIKVIKGNIENGSIRHDKKLLALYR